MCADVLIRELATHIRGDEVLRAFADDTAMVVENYARSMPGLSVVFQEFQSISALSLNIRKTVCIPLWKVASLEAVRTLVREVCPAWRDIVLGTSGKYLGFLLGQVLTAALGTSLLISIYNMRDIGPPYI